ITVPAGGNLGDALAHTCPGDTVDLAAGTYSGGVEDDGVNITGAGQGQTIISGCPEADALGDYAGLLVEPYGTDTTVSDLTVSGCSDGSDDGGGYGIELSSTVYTNAGFGPSSGTVTLDSVEAAGNDGSGIDAAASDQGRMTVKDSVVHDNGGAGVVAAGDTSSLEMDHDDIYGNANAGVLFDNTVTAMEVDNSEIHGNTAVRGGGVDDVLSDVSLTGDEIYGNSATGAEGGDRGEGGGVFDGEARLDLENDYIHDNTAADEGGGVASADSIPTIVDTRIEANTAPAGAGIAADDGLELLGSLVAGNDGDGIDMGDGYVDAVNDTIVANTGQGLAIEQGEQLPAALYLANSIVAGNATDLPADLLTCNASHNILGAEPAFADDEYHLAPGSAAIDAGDNNAVPSDLTTDADGDPRISGAAVDIGYDETTGTGTTTPTGSDFDPDSCTWPTVQATPDPGGIAATDSGADPTPLVPLETSVTVPTVTPAAPATGYGVSVDESYDGDISGPALSEWASDIDTAPSYPTGPAGTAASPYQVVFSFDPSLVSSADGLDVHLDGTKLADCADGSGDAVPDPCVSARTLAQSGDVQLTVLASDPTGSWTFTTTAGAAGLPVSTAVSLSVDSTAVGIGGDVRLTASVVPVPDGGTVEFDEAVGGGSPVVVAGCGAQPVDTTTGLVTCVTSFADAGVYALTASYGGDDSFAGSGPSGSVAVTVTGAGGGLSAQVVSFTAPAAMTYGDPDQVLAASADSGLAVSLTAAPASVCSVVAGGLH
ncbi:MAG: right-handed parallel beta-helix repeat-containing protein, partial [Mycobacterium sp.]